MHYCKRSIVAVLFFLGLLASCGGGGGGQAPASGGGALVAESGKSIVQFGTGGDDVINDIAIEADGYIYVTGVTEGDLFGHTNAGGDDAFIAKYSPAGVLIWSELLGLTGNDNG